MTSWICRYFCAHPPVSRFSPYFPALQLLKHELYCYSAESSSPVTSEAPPVLPLGPGDHCHPPPFQTVPPGLLFKSQPRPSTKCCCPCVTFFGPLLICTLSLSNSTHFSGGNSDPWHLSLFRPGSKVPSLFFRCLMAMSHRLPVWLLSLCKKHSYRTH